jgi:predicted RNA-binding Zn-ribbon protein involved in translation (DUF1610 family)
MEDQITTKEKKCPQCGSVDISYLGVSGVTGSGFPIRKDTQSHQYKCNKCNTQFRYSGKK